MARRVLGAGGAMAATMLLSACFDVQTVETDRTRFSWPLVQLVDDFETGNGRATWSEFQRWSCSAYPDGMTVACDDATEFDLPYHAAVLEFDVGSDEYSGAVLMLGAPDPLDLSIYDELFFTAAVEPMSGGSLPPHVELSATLDCENAAAVATSSEGVSVGIGSAVFLVPGPARRYALDLHRLRQPEWQVVDLQLERIDPSECLRNVSGLSFNVQPELGQSLAGRLILDDIGLHDFPDSDPPAPGLPRLSPWELCLAPAGDVERDCAHTDHGPTMTFAVEDQPGVDDSPAVWLCADAVRVNRTTHELDDAFLDLTDALLLRFDTRFTGAGVSPRAELRAEVTLDCTSLLPDVATDPPYLRREVTMAAGRASYALPLETFEVPPYPIGFDDEVGCLRQVERICFGTVLEDGESAAGTLRVDDIGIE